MRRGRWPGRRIGLYHIGWKIGDGLALLKALHDWLQAAGYAIDGMADHTVSQGLYLRDPDGNELELYVDDPRSTDATTGAGWKRR